MGSTNPSKSYIGAQICTLLFSPDPASIDPRGYPDGQDLLRHPYSDYSSIPPGSRSHHTTRIFVNAKDVLFDGLSMTYVRVEPADCVKCRDFRKALDKEERKIREAGLLEKSCSEEEDDDDLLQDLRELVQIYGEKVKNKVQYPKQREHYRSTIFHHEVLDQMNESMKARIDCRKWMNAKKYFGLREDVTPYNLPSVEARIEELRAVGALSSQLWGDDEVEAEEV